PAAEAAAATSSSEPRRAAPIAPGAVALLHHGARVVALPGVVRPMTREIGSLSGRGHPAQATNQGRTGEHYDGCRIHIAPSLDRRSEEHTSELQSRGHLVCRLLLEKKNLRNQPARRFRLGGRAAPVEAESVVAGWRRLSFHLFVPM